MYESVNYIYIYIYIHKCVIKAVGCETSHKYINIQVYSASVYIRTLRRTLLFGKWYQVVVPCDMWFDQSIFVFYSLYLY